METRTESDSMGEMQVPVDALYGASTARAVENFPIAKRPLPPEVIHAFGHLKAACAAANRDLGKLDEKIAEAIIAAADEVAAGKHDAHFPVDVYQTGSGTSTNMNANEVIANLATRLLATKRSSDPTNAQEANPSPGTPGEGRVRAASGETLAESGALPRREREGAAPTQVHPNDHVNMGQSSNDTFPTAMHVAGAIALRKRLVHVLVKKLLPELIHLDTRWDSIVKTGRTHLMDATPVRMGQVFKGFTRQVMNAVNRTQCACDEMMRNLPVGGTAVGTGINTHPEFAGRVCKVLQQRIGLPFQEAENHFETQSSKDSFIEAHGHLKTVAVSLTKIANDIRLLGSGPRCGIGELILPAIQPGSSIMPGKENPVICESVMQVACRVIGNDATITTAGLGGVGSIFELNVAMPVMIDAFLESVNLLANVCDVFVDKLLIGLQVNEKRCAELVEQSLMNVTAIAPVIGYDNAAKVAKQAMAEGKTIRQIAREQNLLDDATLDKLLDYDAMTRPENA